MSGADSRPTAEDDRVLNDVVDKLNQVHGDTKSMKEQLTHVAYYIEEQKGHPGSQETEDQLETVGDAIQKTTDCLGKLTSDDPIDQLRGALGLMTVATGLATGGPVGTIVSAVFTIFLDLLANTKDCTDGTSAFAKVVHGELLHFRDEEDKREFQGLCDTLSMNYINRYLEQHVTHKAAFT
ncbi:uncharacterized protein [Amphiura filiformis]|uniref:uncharacterized protein n=1 Tax=Amphiura filiformis TaxID=82378 RepID=UPI003B21B2E2